MDKIIRRIKIEHDNKEITYTIGYNECIDKINPVIRIYQRDKYQKGYICETNWDSTRIQQKFYSDIYDASIYSFIGIKYTDTIDKAFRRLRKYVYIPEYIETEFENFFLLCKINNFNRFKNKIT